MPQEELLLYVRRASRGQTTTSLAVAALMLVAFLAALPFASLPLRQYNAFIPVIDTVLLIGDCITAAILFAQASVMRSRALIVLATGYLFAGLIIIPHALSFPGAFAPQGVIGGGPSTTVWLYIFWHSGLPLTVIAYAILRRADEGRPPPAIMRPGVPVCIAGAVLMAASLTLLATAGQDLLPHLMQDPFLFSGSSVDVAAALMTVLLAIALATVWKGSRSLLDIWLMVALWAWMLEAFMVVWTDGRYNLGWYSGRFAGMLSGMFVLLALLVETSRLYVQVARSAVSEQQHREGRLMSLDAAASAIAHEVKQPITAMVTNASAALIRIERDVPDLPKVKRALEMIVDDGHRAADTIASIRALFGREEADKVKAGINQLIREAIDLLSVEIASRGIVISTALAPGLPDLDVQRLQIRQVFVNLITNAIDALGERPAGPRRIVIRSESAEDGGVAIDITDSGRGIAADQIDRIFDAFVTTKAYGTGMGLPLCRSIVEGHGGKLWASSEEGRSSTFHIRLPGGET